MSNKTIQITTLGSFEIKFDDRCFSSVGMSGQSSGLLSYLFLHKNSSAESIIDALWPDGVANPAAALKTLVYRIRKSLSDGGVPFAKELIVSANGAYKINSEFDVQLDVELMESAFSKAQKAQSTEEKIQLYKEGLSLYNGEFLGSLSCNEWVLPLAQHFHTAYFQNVYSLLAIYYKQEDYPSLLECSKQAAHIDKYEELAHRYAMLAISKISGGSKALAYYNYVTELFYNGLGVELSDSMQQLYAEISKASTVGNTSIKALQLELKESNNAIPEALSCDFEVFKQLYHFAARSSVRSNASDFIALLTITPDEDVTTAENNELRETAMAPLKDAISSSLRKGDVFSRCSPSQYAVLLSMINFENSDVVLTRIIKKFKTLFRSRRVTVSYNIQPVRPSFWE